MFLFLTKLSFKNKLFLLLLFLSISPVLILGSFVLSSIHSNLNKDLNLLTFFSSTLIFLSIVITAIASFWLSRKLTLSLDELSSETDQSITNNLNYQLKITGTDEIGHLGTSINTLLKKLKDSSQKNNYQQNLLSLEKKMFELSLSRIKDPIIVLNPERRVLYLNQAASNFLEVDLNQVLKKPLKEIITISDEKSVIPDTVYAPTKATSTNQEVFDKKPVKIKTIFKELFAQLSSVRFPEGAPIGVGTILTFHDTTKETQLEAMKMDFISMAAHELRTPLTSIKGYISVFINENKNKFTPDQMMFLQRINISSQQIMALVENLLNVSRIERGAFAVNLVAMDWVANIKKCVAELNDRAKEKRITLSFQDPATIFPQVRADPLRINEVLNNLITNAIKYTEPGGKVTIWLEKNSDSVITHVSDTGHGIPKEAIPHLFGKFYRVPGRLELAQKGTGLGLYIAKSIVDLHHGKIWVNSEIEKGSTFSFTLPIA